MSESTTRI